MHKSLSIKSASIIGILILSFFCSTAVKAYTIRNINIAGLIFNAETLLPISGANIYDDENHLLGTTDDKGYFKLTIIYSKSGELYFSLKIKKQGYSTFTQNEHWGDMPDNSKAVMYFGLKGSHSHASAFSDLDNSSELTFNSIIMHFNRIKGEKKFNDEVSLAKKGNEYVFIQINSKYYIVDNGGWIQLNSDKDSIVIDNKRVIVADQLNAAVKRKNIKRMTPVKGGKVAIYTR